VFGRVALCGADRDPTGGPTIQAVAGLAGPKRTAKLRLELAERSELCADTIRRIEHDDLSPNLRTLYKLGDGLDLQLSTLFSGCEHGGGELGRELVDLLRSRSPRVMRIGIRLLRTLFERLDMLDESDAP
jgi:transcriptional regulator with XRE-family HTH domain